MVRLTPADIAESTGAIEVLEALKRSWPKIKHLLADGPYERCKLYDKAAFLDFVVEVVHKLTDQHTSAHLPRRSVVERSFRWMTHWRRLVRDYEKRLDVSTAVIHIAMGSSLLRRLPTLK